MRFFTLALLLASLTAFASPAAKQLDQAVSLFERGSIAQARDRFSHLVNDRHLTRGERIKARLYLAQSELALQNPDAARAQLEILFSRHPEVRPDPSIYLPDLVALADQVRAEVEARGPPADQREAAAERKRAEAERRAKKDAEDREAARKAEEAKQQEEAKRQEETRRQEEAAREARSQPEPYAPPAQSLTPKNALPAAQPALPDAETEAEVASSSRRTWAYVALGVGAAAAAVGAVMGMKADSAADQAAKATNQDAYLSARNDAKSAASAATVSFIAAGVVATGGAVLFSTTF